MKSKRRIFFNFVLIQLLCLVIPFMEFDFHETFYHTLIAYLLIDIIVVLFIKKLALDTKLTRYVFYLSPLFVLIIISYLVPWRDFVSSHLLIAP